MTFDIGAEAPITLRQAARLLPRRRAGRPAHVSTLYRWALRGLRGVTLETIQIGGTLCTSREALQRFFARLSRAQPAPAQATTALRRRAVQRADEELDQIGI
jgi:hypothetical protein